MYLKYFLFAIIHSSFDLHEAYFVEAFFPRFFSPTNASRIQQQEDFIQNFGSHIMILYK